MSKRNIIIAIIIVAVSVAGYFSFFKKDDSGQYDTVIAERGVLTHEVSVSGNVIAAQQVDLAFEQSGTVASVYTKIGDSVYAGQSLVAQKSGDTYAMLLGAQSDRDTQKAVLDELNRGTRPEELIVYEVKVTAAQEAFLEAEIDAVNKITDAFTKSDDAVRNNVDQLFSNPRGTSPTFNYNVYEQQLKIEIESGRFAIEKLLDTWGNDLPSTSDDVLAYLDTAQNNTKDVKDFLDKISLAVNALIENSSISQTTIDGYKTDIYTARSNINTAITNLNTAKEKLSTKESNLIISEKEFALKQAGASAEEVAAQEAKVKSAEAAVLNYEAQLAKTVLRAPFAGTVTKQDAKVGEIATANTILVSLVSNSALEIETFIPEADIAKVVVGNKAIFTLDAYEDDEEFIAEVYLIEPAETVIEGVSTYKTLMRVTGDDKRVRIGMTANVEILTAQKSNVLAVPSRAVFSDNGNKYARVLLEDGTVEERVVQTGLRGSEGRVEILSGIEEGDKIITFERR
ncbi:efflux RND transporter periplasmic adaptor subunit [Patescibacteria group bacterium]